MADDAWLVHPHEAPVRLDERLWHVTGSVPKSPLPRNMVVYRLDDGRLLVHSAICLDDEGMAWLDGLGAVAVVVVPNGYHRLDAPRFKARYPQAQLVCPAAVRARVEKVVAVDATVEEALPLGGARWLEVPGIKPVERIYELELSDGQALVMADALFNLPDDMPGLSGWLMRVMGSAGFFGITFLGRRMLMTDRTALRNWLQEQAARQDLRHLCVGHGAPVEPAHCEDRLREAASRLL